MTPPIPSGWRVVLGAVPMMTAVLISVSSRRIWLERAGIGLTGADVTGGLMTATALMLIVTVAFLLVVKTIGRRVTGVLQALVGIGPYPYESLQDTGDATTNCLHHKQKSHRHDEHQRRGRHQSTRNVGPRQTDSGSFEPDTTRGYADKDRRHHWDGTEHDPPATWDRRRHRLSSRSADSDPEL